MLRSVTLLACLLPLGQMAWGAAFCFGGCPDIYSPVCGSDNNTYINNCELEQAACRDHSLHQVYEGLCELKTKCGDGCAAVYQPVCGSDGKNYSNVCHLNIKACRNPHLNLSIAHDGVCKPKRICFDICPTMSGPWCGSDGQTHFCPLKFLTCENPRLTFGHEGHCRSAAFCHGRCYDIYIPVCGSNNKTYNNNCELEQAACRDHSLHQVYEGLCELKTECGDGCAAVYQPVCGSDGKNYSNVCHLNIKACRNPHLNLTIAYDGVCKPKRDCFDICTRMSGPWCGTDGKTYYCSLKFLTCENPHLAIAYDGHCNPKRECQKVCTIERHPVCGSDGKTYSNSCYLDATACYNPHLLLRVVHDGACS